MRNLMTTFFKKTTNKESHTRTIHRRRRARRGACASCQEGNFERGTVGGGGERAGRGGGVGVGVDEGRGGEGGCCEEDGGAGDDHHGFWFGFGLVWFGLVTIQNYYVSRNCENFLTRNAKPP